MIPERGDTQKPRDDLSRVCGDDPDWDVTGKEISKFVPRMRG